jgi:hypothetical protein
MAFPGEDGRRWWGLGGEKARGKPCAPFGARNRGQGSRKVARRRRGAEVGRGRRRRGGSGGSGRRVSSS